MMKTFLECLEDMSNSEPSLEQSAQSFINALIRENQQLKKQINQLHERLQDLAIRCSDLLDLNIHTAHYAKTQSPESLENIYSKLECMIPPPEIRTEYPNYYIEDDDYLTIYEDTARLAAELFPDDPYFQPYKHNQTE